MIQVTEMLVFKKVVDKKSFTEAARELGFSTASVSKYVGALEERLKAQLLNRTTRRVVVTEIGKAFYQRCVSLLSDLEEAEASVTHSQQTARGTLRVGAPMSFGIHCLGEPLAKFLAKNSEVSIELLLSDRIGEPVPEELDVSLRVVKELTDSSLVAVKLAKLRRVLCASPGYLKKRGRPKVPEDLRDHDCLSYSLSDSSEAWSFERNGKAFLVDVNGKLKVNNSVLIRDFLLSNGGIAPIPTFLVADDLKAGRLVVVLDKYYPEPRQLVALYPQRKHLSQKVRLFVDFLKDYFGRKKW